MADTKTTGLTENTAPISTDIMPMVDDPGGSALTQKVTMATLQSLLAVGIIPGGRLTLTTATPVTTADVTGATTLYYTPYVHDRIGLYDGASWRSVSFTEKSLSLVGYTASKPYDIFGYLSSGTLALESLVWTNATTRATALAYQDGRLVKSGDATRRYLGTIYVNSSGAQTDDSVTKRFVWNYYNRCERKLLKRDNTSHTYTTGSWRSWNNDTALRVELITGVSENPLWINVAATSKTSATTVSAYVAAGLDVTNNVTENLYVMTQNAGLERSGAGQSLFTGIGYHFVQLTQLGGTTATFDDAMVSGYIIG